MTGVFTGFAVIMTLILAGYLAARFGVIEARNRLVLNKVSFYVAEPALLFGIVANSRLNVMISPVVLIYAVTSVLVAAVFWLMSRFFFRSDPVTTMLGAATTGYSNVNNMGIPIGIYVLGTAAFTPPLIILQMVLFTPIILAVLEASRGSNKGAMIGLGRALTNPIIIGVAAGLVFSITGWTVPDIIGAPLEMLGGAAIPLILISFGASFVGQRLFERGEGLRMVVSASLIKAIVAPLTAWVIAGPILGLDAFTVFAATVVAALPSAQNLYNWAAIYGRSELVIRNIVFITTFGSLPVILVIAWLVGV